MGVTRGIADRVEQALASASELEHLGAFWELDGERALERARALDDAAASGEPQGVLAGTVCAWKDCFDVAGLHTTGGAPWRSGEGPAPASATIVARVEAAGAISLGKLAMTQLAWGMMGQTPGRPACRNPHDPERVPGGSSSGSAVAVASGIVDHAPGTDAGGSVRHPAAACGVVGFKPTYGSVPLDGCMPYAPSFDTGGAIARSVDDAALQYSVIAAVPLPDLEGGLAGLRIGLLGGYFTAALEDDVAAMLESVRARVRTSEVELGWTQTDNRSMGPVFTAEPGAYVLAHDQSPATDAYRYDPGTLADVEAARTLPAIEYLRALRELAEARSRCAAAAAGFDILLAASAPCAPVPLDGPDKTTRMNALTKPFNALGWPALALPAGSDRHGLPLSLQVIGLPGRDGLVLRAAAALEGLVES
jgi:Asp-tRNA(Asn)/Glu-tRNA(Gln) amidotransferase A subunit family amidase